MSELEPITDSIPVVPGVLETTGELHYVYTGPVQPDHGYDAEQPFTDDGYGWRRHLPLAGLIGAGAVVGALVIGGPILYHDKGINPGVAVPTFSDVEPTTSIPETPSLIVTLPPTAEYAPVIPTIEPTTTKSTPTTEATHPTTTITAPATTKKVAPVTKPLPPVVAPTTGNTQTTDQGGDPCLINPQTCGSSGGQEVGPDPGPVTTFGNGSPPPPA